MTRSVIILLVEDDPSMLDGMSDLLQVMDIGYEVNILTASDGLRALEVMSEQTPDLIVSDIMMPKVDGFQFLQEVRKNPSWVHIPFIFLTAKGEKQEVYQGRVSGADLYITKPFNSSELLELIKTQLDRAFQLRLTHQQNMDNLKKGILQILNHEFRTPLTYVTAYYEMLADSVNKFTDGLNFQEYLRGIQAGCIRLNRLVEDFIQVIELRTGEAQAAYEQHAQPIDDLDTLLREAIEAKQEQADRRNVHVHYHIESNLPSVFGDRRSLLEVFHRLLDNAIKFTYAHHLHQEGDGNVFIATAVKANEIHISIKDEGIGFPSRIQNKIFELFFQHNRGLLEQQGAGTGLTIAEGLVKLHKGRIEVESQQDVGSQFTIVLPIFEGSISRTELPLSQDDSERKEATVLIVEDDRHLLEGLQELLEIFDGKYRLNVMTAPNGEAGLEVLRKCQSDLIISDIMMPYMDGYKFLEQVRQNPDWLHIPFIFLTAKGERQDIHRGWRSGVEEYVTKPYDSDALLGLVVKQLDRYFQMQGIHAQNFDALKRSILNLITPDFRLPLSSVTEYSQKLATELDEAETDAELKESLQGIQAGSARLTRLVEDFIALAELRTGEADTAHALQAQPINELGLVLYEATQILAYKETAEALHVHCPLNRELPPVYGNSATLQESVQRLLKLGISYWGKAEEATVHLTTTAVNDEVLIRIHFEGELEEDKANAFRSILAGDHQEQLSSLPEYAPSLKIIRGYIDLHNGRIELSNSEADGYTFTIALPIYSHSSELQEA